MNTKIPTASFLLLALLLSACTSGSPSGSESQNTSETSSELASSSIDDFTIAGVAAPDTAGFGQEIPYEEADLTISPKLATDFSINEVKNIAAMAEAYGITLSAKDKKLLSERKFLMKQLADTTIVPKLTHERSREFLGLYNAVAGGDAKSRTQANTIFWTSDIFFHSYTLLQVELLKEMENTVFAPAMRTLSKTFYQSAAEKLAKAKTDTDKTKWKKVRNYFAVPHALLSTSISPLSNESYFDASGVLLDPTGVMDAFTKDDKAADTEEKATAFIDTLSLDAESKTAVLADIHRILDAQEPDVPAIFKPEYDDYTLQKEIQFKVDFTQFTPRSHYTSSSFRRQYFRAMNWYIQVPFFVESDPLTEYAFAISELMAEHPEQLRSYSLLESTINFMVGTSDDLMPVDYLHALEATDGKKDQSAEIRSYLLAVKQPKIKSIAAQYPTVGEKQSADVLAATTGMRFFSGKFIMDSYWTGYLTQGDEAPRPGYPAKLPPMASSLQVMALLGSDYAKQKIPTLDFYTPENGKAIEKAMSDLAQEVQSMTDTDWRENAYTTALWTMKGLFDFEQSHRKELPRFMQSDAWSAKTLQAAAGFWTEVRHAVLLYAKQSFAELGAGGSCDSRKVPDPAKGYIEPQPLAYKRLKYLAERTHVGLKTLGFTLQNFYPLETYVSLMDTVITYTDKQLANSVLDENVVEHRDDDPDEPSGKCTWYEITQSDWETLRKDLLSSLNAALPFPVEGPVLSAKDMRAAIVADVHTGGDSQNPTNILYEGTGVPYVILTAVKDANGPRLAIGFTYSQYEFREPLGGKRLTDEEWQKRFYEGDDENNPFQYTPPSSWPKLNSWYAPLFPSE